VSRNHWDYLEDFVDLSQRLVERWESGDIAEIVNGLRETAAAASAYMADDEEETTDHNCEWHSVTWDGPKPENIQAGEEGWSFEQHGTCSCGRRVKEVFISDGVLRDLETGKPVEGED
jgi:hypothetical protein